LLKNTGMAVANEEAKARDSIHRKGGKRMTVQQRHAYSWGIIFFVALAGMAQTLWAEPIANGRVIPVQVPYEAPPKGQDLPAESVPQNTKPLTDGEVQRAEALLPLLEGTQEFWAMGEFVHLGEPSVPVLVKGLTMAGPRIRYNVIETISMLKAASAVPALVAAAKEPNEIPRVREHALRVAVRLDAVKVVDAIEVMAKDQNSSIRKVAAFEARYVREKSVVPVLIGMIADEERFVALSAVQSLWILTRHETEFHDWETSTKQDRQEWTTEWLEWWNGQKDSFEMSDAKRPARAR
jgi:HEAT repeat protein